MKTLFSWATIILVASLVALSGLLITGDLMQIGKAVNSEIQVGDVYEWTSPDPFAPERRIYRVLEIEKGYAKLEITFLNHPWFEPGATMEGSRPVGSVVSSRMKLISPPQNHDR